MRGGAEREMNERSNIIIKKKLMERNESEGAKRCDAPPQTPHSSPSQVK